MLTSNKDFSNQRCCICGQPLYNGHSSKLSEAQKTLYFGNNPWPVSTNENDRCCDYCDTTVVIPERIKQFINSSSN